MPRGFRAAAACSLVVNAKDAAAPRFCRRWSSRRIFGEHRLVYRVSGKRREQRLEIVQCRYHY
jgi:Txe/YoeB family toxin of Txe-Axe toxin-antitoxin module